MFFGNLNWHNPERWLSDEDQVGFLAIPFKFNQANSIWYGFLILPSLPDTEV